MALFKIFYSKLVSCKHLVFWNNSPSWSKEAGWSNFPGFQQSFLHCLSWYLPGEILQLTAEKVMPGVSTWLKDGAQRVTVTVTVTVQWQYSHIFANLDTGLEGILNKFAEETKMWGASDFLKGRKNMWNSQEMSGLGNHKLCEI